MTVTQGLPRGIPSDKAPDGPPAFRLEHAGLYGVLFPQGESPCLNLSGSTMPATTRAIPLSAMSGAQGVFPRWEQGSRFT
ncbi:hypothetical protein MASR2M17_01030 [Aminivibrio sp.]